MAHYFKFNLLFLVLLILLSACNYSISEKKKNINYPSYILEDPLFTNSKIMVMDTFSNALPKEVRFCDKTDTAKVYVKQYYENGSVRIEGLLVNNKRSGKWVAWYENKEMWSICNYNDGRRHGLNETFYENGVLRYSKTFNNDTVDGSWTFYDENSVKIGEVVYCKGVEIKRSGDIETNK